MSGGSYDYLCWHTEPSELGSRFEQIEQMAADLDKLGPEALAASTATYRVADLLRQASALAKSLEDVWHDVEWWQSCDYSEDDARDTAAAYVEPDDQES